MKKKEKEKKRKERKGNKEKKETNSVFYQFFLEKEKGKGDIQTPK